MAEESMKRITLRVTEDFRRQARMRALEVGLPLAEIVRRLLKAWLEGRITLPEE